jgi:lipopolysaccharide/colanic/teichoic acid biosynthesis glycosyltransferase
MSRIEEIAKRACDIAIAISGLLLLSPLLCLVSLAIKLDSRGPVLCRQTRYSLTGTTIEVFGFRLTTSDQRDRTINSLAIAIPRITRVGQILRRTDIAKIPQLINVIHGEMSIVGTCLYSSAPGEAAHTRNRLFPLQRNAKPGMLSWANTSCWEKSGSAAKLLQHRIERDLYYIDNRTFLFDVKIFLLALCLNEDTRFA